MENLNPLVTPTILILQCTAFHLFLNHHCYLQNIFYTKTFQFLKPFPGGVYLFTQWKHEFVKYVKYA